MLKVACSRASLWQGVVGAPPVRGQGLSPPRQFERRQILLPLFGPKLRTRATTKGGPMSSRPLPAHPNLDFEHKAAKKLLHQARLGDPIAISRMRAHEVGSDLKLADAQLVIAREYGFASWPRL